MSEHETPNPESLNRDRLNKLTQQALAPGSLFGKDLELTEQDRQQFQVIADRADAALASHYEDPAWQEYERLAQEGGDKGVLTSFSYHQGLRVPTWCVDGGEGDDVAVKKVLIASPNSDDKRPGIEVPSRVFNLVHWTNTINSLRSYVRQSNDTVKGRSTKDLGDALHGLGVLLNGTPETE